MERMSEFKFPRKCHYRGGVEDQRVVSGIDELEEWIGVMEERRFWWKVLCANQLPKGIEVL